MRAKDLMTTDVVSVTSDTSVRHLAQILLRHRISAVPVLDDHGKLVGMVSEGDLMRRVETGTQLRGSWWLRLLASPEQTAAAYVRSHAWRVGDIMTADVVSVGEDEQASRIAVLLEEKRIKRVPVCRDGRVIGIVSRADLLHGLATAKLEGTPPGDEAIRRAVLARLRTEAGVRDGLMNVTVSDGVVHLWGGTLSEIERKAARVSAETVSGVRAVKDHLPQMPALVGE